jgi:ribosomal protein L30
MALKIKLTKSFAGASERQLATIRGLGLTKFGQERILKDTPEIRGMIFKVQHLVSQVLPRLVYFLECRGARPPNCAGVFVSIFAGDQLYFVRAGDMVQELSRLSGLSLEQMVERYGR